MVSSEVKNLLHLVSWVKEYSGNLFLTFYCIADLSEPHVILCNMKKEEQKSYNSRDSAKHFSTFHQYFQCILFQYFPCILFHYF